MARAAGSRSRRSSELFEAGPPPPAADRDAPKPIGVPEGFVAVTPPGPGRTLDELPRGADPRMWRHERMPTPSRATPPQYFEGAQYAPAAMSVSDIARLQRRMEAAGVFEKGAKYRLGVWDDASRSAYAELLGFANSSGLSVEQALTMWSQTQAVEVGAEPEVDEPEPEPLPLNPADLRDLAQTAARSRIGRRFTDDELERFESAYRQLESTYMPDPETGMPNTEFAAPSTEAWAAEQAQRIAPEAAFGQSGAERMDEFFSLLGGPV